MSRRKPGKRYKNGQRVKPTADERRETDWETKRPVLERVCRQVGLDPDKIEDLKRADKFGGTVWGKVYLAGAINRSQFEAADRFAVLRHEYLIAKGLPSENAKGADLMAIGGKSNRDEPTASQRRVMAEYAALPLVLVPIVQAFTAGGMVDMGRLRAALDKLAEHFGVMAGAE